MCVKHARLYWQSYHTWWLYLYTYCCVISDRTAVTRQPSQAFIHYFYDNVLGRPNMILTSRQSQADRGHRKQSQSKAFLNIRRHVKTLTKGGPILWTHKNLGVTRCNDLDQSVQSKLRSARDKAAPAGRSEGQRTNRTAEKRDLNTSLLKQFRLESNSSAWPFRKRKSSVAEGKREWTAHWRQG